MKWKRIPAPQFLGKTQRRSFCHCLNSDVALYRSGVAIQLEGFGSRFKASLEQDWVKITRVFHLLSGVCPSGAQDVRKRLGNTGERPSVRVLDSAIIGRCGKSGRFRPD